MSDTIKKYHYICKDSDGGLFMTTERCSSKEDAKQYVGDSEVLYPFIEDVYEEIFLGYKKIFDAPFPNIENQDMIDTGKSPIFLNVLDEISSYNIES